MGWLLLFVSFLSVIGIFFGAPSFDDSIEYSLLDGSIDFGVNNAIVKISSTASESFIGNNLAPLPGLQPLRCEQYLEDVYNGIINISDPNDFKVYARRIQGITDNPFWVAVHEEKFDSVRWGSIFVLGRYYESKMNQAFVDILRQSSPEARVIDVGGNIGWFTLLSRSMGFAVEAFEPSKRNSARLCESMRMNRWSNVLEKTYDNILPLSGGGAGRYVNVYDVALGERDGNQTFNFHPTNPGQGSLSKMVETNVDHLWSQHSKRSDVVEVATLDSFIRSKGWFEEPIEIAILKVDIEGYEPHVFAGAQQLLKSHMIKNILLELSPDMPRNNKSPNILMINRILEAGYRVHMFGGYQGPNMPNPFPAAPTNKLAKLLVELTMERKVKQLNLWFKIA
jgi:FkbM family methyltransferase